MYIPFEVTNSFNKYHKLFVDNLLDKGKESHMKCM